MFVHGAVRVVARLVVMPADKMRRIKKTTKCNSLLLLTNAEA